jgi:spectinomycin phosphotransferase
VETPPEGVSDAALIDCVSECWGLDVDQLDYVPRGFGSHHWRATATDATRCFVCVDDLDHKPMLGSGREAAFHGMQAALDTALALNREAGLSFVVAPVPSHGGGTVRRLDPRYSIAVFPFVDGRPGDWGDSLTREERDQLLRLLGELHLAAPRIGTAPPERGTELAGRAELEQALGDIGRPWDGGPFSEPARRLLAEHAGKVREWLATFDGHAARVGSRRVITHGEPHPGNLMRVGSRLLLIDWDTVARTPPERDLWMLDDGSEGAFTAYRETTGWEVDRTALALYRLGWTLADVASFVDALRAPHTRNPDTELAWRCLSDYLAPPGPATGG